VYKSSCLILTYCCVFSSVKINGSSNSSSMDRACFAHEVIAIREGRLSMTCPGFARGEMDDVIAYLVT